MTSPLLEARNVSKSFPGVQALNKVDLTLHSPEVLALVGENGAGKSTLMKILAGVETADEGEFLFGGSPVNIASLDNARELGITLIHQELNLATNLDVASNVFLGREPQYAGLLGLIHSRIYSEAKKHTDRLGLDCSVRTPVAQLSIGQQQLVEIARALSEESRILIMDEPTSSLTPRETERLFDVIRSLKQEGITILYISHRLNEVQEIADRVVVLRDGENAGELAREEITHDAMVQLMVGRELNQFFHREHAPPAESAQTTGVFLRVEDLRLDIGSQVPINFSIRGGEVVGVAGLMGAGRTELAETLFGAREAVTGQLFIEDKPARIRSVSEAIQQGIFLLPEDRREEGLVLAMSVKENVSLASLEQTSRFGIIQTKHEEELAQAQTDQLNIRTPGLKQIVGLLSGGNQQKVVLGKGLARGPRLLILDEPTRGIDVGAKSEIYTLIDQLAQQGMAILMISSDLEEILGMSDRVLVMHQGSLAGELSREQLSEQAIMTLATGGKDSE